MALTEDRLRSDAPTYPPPAPLESDRLSRRTSVGLMLAWVILFPLGLSLEPMPAAEAASPWWAYIASFALLGGVVATFVGLSRRMMWGVGASLGASLLFAAGVFACPATGHHAFGLWWFGEFGASLGLVGASGAAYLRAR